jgi:hypothetical protein
MDEQACEQTIIRRGREEVCDRKAAGECVRCKAQLCADHSKTCQRCGGLICDDFFCSHPHEVACRSVFGTMDATIGEVDQMVARRMSPDYVAKE